MKVSNFFVSTISAFLVLNFSSCTYAPNNSSNNYNARQMVVGASNLPKDSVVSSSYEDGDVQNENNPQQTTQYTPPPNTAVNRYTPTRRYPNQGQLGNTGGYSGGYRLSNPYGTSGSYGGGYYPVYGGGMSNANTYRNSLGIR
jgi:hypothetical protein